MVNNGNLTQQRRKGGRFGSFTAVAATVAAVAVAATVATSSMATAPDVTAPIPVAAPAAVAAPNTTVLPLSPAFETCRGCETKSATVASLQAKLVK